MPDAATAVARHSDLERLLKLLQLLGLKRSRRAPISIPKLPPVSRLFAALAALIVLAVLNYLHDHATPVPAETIYSYYSLDALRQKVFETDWVTPAIVWTFLFGCFYLIGIAGTKRKYLADAESSKIYKAVMDGELTAVMRSLLTADEPHKLGYYDTRLHALVARWDADADLPAVQALKNEIVELDEQDVAHSFVPVGWCETALPLLGFLGTVIGIGAAIGHISEAIELLLKQAASDGHSSLDAMFHRGFESMALAFDTTFFGLFFLLVLGVLNILTKKSLANRLDHARRFYSLALAQLPKGHQSASPDVSFERLCAHMEQVEATLRAIDEQSTAYKSRIEGLVQHVIMEGGEQFDAIRKALMRPVIEFETVEEEPRELFAGFVTEQTGTQAWRTGGLGLTAGTPTGGIVSVRGADKTWLVTFRGQLNENNQIHECSARLTHLFPNEELSAFAAKDENNQVWIGTLTAISQQTVAGAPRRRPPAAALEQISVEVRNDLPPLAVDGNGILLPVSVGQGLEVKFLSIAAGARPVKVVRLPGGYNWGCWDFSRTTRTLLAAGQPIGDATAPWVMIFYSIPLPVPDGSAADIPQIARWVLPRDTQVRSIGIVDKTACLFLAGNRLYYMDESRTTPKKVESPELPNAITNILPNRHGWVALVAAGRLSMWSCRRGGMLAQDGTHRTFGVGEIKDDGFCVSADGRHLYGAEQLPELRQRAPIKWSFAKSVSDPS